MTPNSPELVRADEAAFLWKSVLHTPSPRFSPAMRDSVVEHTRCLERTQGVLRIAVESREIDGWLRGGHLAAVDASLASLSDGEVALAVIPVDGLRKLCGDPSYDFHSFVASPASGQARARALAFTREARPANGLAICGGGGSGKTHLLRAIAGVLGESRGADGVLCCGAEQLSLELIRAIGGDAVEAFRERLGSLKALVVDDLDAIVGRDATQEALAQTLATLAERKVPVAVSLARAVDRTSGLVDSLRARLLDFMPLELRPLEWETRVAIIMARIRRWHVEPEQPVAAYLASRLRSQLGRLDVVLTRLMTRSSSGNALADLDVVKHLIAGSDKPLAVAPEDVLNAVARQFNLRVRDLRSTGRSARVTTPRQIAMYLMRRHCGLSYPEIGRRFARHHTTALHSDRVIQEQLAENASLRAAVVLVEKELLRLAEGGG
jgi:chromosomal replication initiator protein